MRSSELSLIYPVGVNRQGVRDRLGARLQLCDGMQWRGIGLEAQRGAARLEPDVARPEQDGSPGPGGAVALPLLRAQLRAQGDELGEVLDDPDLAVGRDADEPVRVEVVAEQNRRGGIGRREEAWTPVVEEVALVDRLEPEGEGDRREGREDRLLFPLGHRSERSGPERALALGLAGDHIPDRELSGRRTHGPPPRSRRSPRRRGPWRGRAPRTARAPRRSRWPAGAGTRRRSAPCRSPTRRGSSARGRRGRTASPWP